MDQPILQPLLFPFARCDKGCTVLLYGAGMVGRDYVRCLEKSKFAKKIIWADKNYKKLQDIGLNVISIDDALQQYFNYIVIAIENETTAKLIMEDFLIQGIAKEKLIWEKPIRIMLYK